jgi:hypothetical protein
MNILKEYQSINYYELASHKEASAAWSLENNMKTVEDRVVEYADRFKNAIK